MLIKEKAGTIEAIQTAGKIVEYIGIEWFEANKRILHKQTSAGRPVTLKFLQQNPDLKEGDVLYADELLIIAIEMKPCEVLVIQPASIAEAAAICYEIGNKHLPLYFQQNELLVPYDASIDRLLQAAGYAVNTANRKLSNPVKTSVLPHGHSAGTSLFNKILQLTTPS